MRWEAGKRPTGGAHSALLFVAPDPQAGKSSAVQPNQTPEKNPACCVSDDRCKGRHPRRSEREEMNSKIIRRLIVVAIALEFLWLFYLPAGNQLSPRSPEMAQALRAFETNRTAATEAAMRKQLRRDDSREWRRKEVLFGLMLLADAAVIYFYWNYGTNKPQRNKSQV
jgi:hypothetical protein